MAVATEAAVQRMAQVLCLVFKAAIGGVIHIQAGHLVETDQAVYRAFGQVGFHPGAELFVAPMIEERLDRRHQHLEARWDVAFQISV